MGYQAPLSAHVYLGFDFGLRRIGVAVGRSVPCQLLKTLNCITAGEPDWKTLEDLIKQWQPSGLIVGIPLHADGKAHTLTHRAKRFARQLSQQFDLPVHRADERWSSTSAHQELIAARRNGLVGKQRGRRLSDAKAAAIILDSWLSNQQSADV